MISLSELQPIKAEYLPFFADAPKALDTREWYKVYNDGGHYVASKLQKSKRRVFPTIRKHEEIDKDFYELYYAAVQDGLKDYALTNGIKTRLAELHPEHPNLDEYVAEKIERAKFNLYKRKKRFRRKAYLNKWNYFVTFTYDDEKQTEETFRKKLRRCLSNLHTRRGWRYMGVFERAPETGRLHFHGIMYVPDGEMIGNITETRDYSTSKHEMQTAHINDFFADKFGRNDFEELNEMELKHGQSLNYILKYIGKTGERIVYSRGIQTEILARIDEKDIITEMEDFVTKYILFDDVLSWEKDIMHFSYKQVSMFDMCRSSRRFFAA